MPVILHYVSIAADVRDAIFLCLDQTTPLTLSLLAISCYVVVHQIRYPRSVYPRVAGACFLIGYFSRCLAFNATDPHYLAMSFFRSVVAYEVVRTLCVIVASSAMPIINEIRMQRVRKKMLHKDTLLQKIQSHFRNRRYEQKSAQAKRRAARLAKKPPKPAPEPKPRADRLKEAAAKSQEEFEAEIDALKTLKLDAAEFKVLENRAKQRLLQKLSQIQNA